MRDAFELALDHLGRKMGGLPVEVIYEDDGLKPDVGKQKTDKLIESDKVNFLTGYIWSNVLLASLKSAVDAQTFLISANAGPSQIAGELCSPWFFSVSWQGDQVPQAIGEYMNQKGVKSAFLIAPNYAAGKDVIAGLKANFKGRSSARNIPNGRTSSISPPNCRKRAPPSRMRSSPSIPAPPASSFSRNIRRPASRRRSRSTPPSSSTRLSLPRLGELALGVPGAQHWVTDLPNEANKKFVADFQTKYGRDPSFYAAQAYDSAMLIDSAVAGVKGDLSKKDAMRDAMRKANYASVRGPTDTATTTSRSRISICRKR